jgi:predicted nucleic acid-binding protein
MGPLFARDTKRLGINMAYIIDTNVLIDLYKGRLPESCATKLAQWFIDGDCVLSIITQAELLSLSSITDQEKAFINMACSQSIILDFHGGYLEDVIAVRTARKIKMPDAIIAGMALKHQMTVLTANVDDFKNIPNLKVVHSFEIDSII